MHYLAQWGPDGQQGQMNMGVLDMVLVSTGDKAANCDRDGNTAERLAMNAEYDGHLDVAKHIATFLHKKGLGNTSSGSSVSSTVEVIRTPKYKSNRPVLNINVASPRNGNLFNFHSPVNDAPVAEETVIEHAPEGNIEASLSMSARENISQNTPRSFSEVQSPKLGGNRAFSWDDQGPNNNNNENNNARDNFSVSGSTWTTHLSTPPKSAPHANRQTRPQAAFPPMSPRQAPPMSPRHFPPMSPRQAGRVSTPKAKARPQQTAVQPETRQDDESGRGNQSFQSSSTNSTNYSSQLTQQLVEMAEMERREGLESPRGGNRLESPSANRAFVPKKNEKSVSEAILLEEIARLKAEKERAEVDLAKAKGANLGGMMGSLMSLSELSPIGEDEMSRLTTDEHDLEEEKQPIDVPSKEIGVTKMAPPGVSEIERLEKEREMIDIQLKKAREGPIDPEEESDHEEVKDDYKGLFEQEQNDHISTKNMLQEERKKHGEAMQSHLTEVKSLRESLERATDEIAKHQSLQSEMKELQKKELDWDIAREKLEAEIRHLKEKEPSAEQNHGGVDNSSVASTLTNNSGLDSSVLKMQYENSVKEANDLRKFSAAIRKEHNETISELEGELERERSEKVKVMSNVVSLEYRISTLEEELEVARSDKSMGSFNSAHIAELEGNLERESSTNYNLQQRVFILEKELEEAMSRKKHGGDIDRMAFELHQLKRRLSDKLEEAEKSKERLDAAKMEFERKEENLLEQLDDAQEQLMMTKKHRQDSGDAEDSYLQKIRDLKLKIRGLEEDDDRKSAKLREAEKVKQRTIQEKEDECHEKIRQLKKEYEEKLQDKEDEYFQEMRELKKKQEIDLQDNEAAVTKKMQDGKMNDSSFDLDVNKMIQEKENAFNAEVAKLTAEIEALRQESKLSDQSNVLEAKLLECKSDLKSQSRKHRSEINKLKNTLEMQKSKEARLEGHMKALEKQIMDMTADYEARIQEYLYGNMDTE
eukprot:scaffold46208_cov139-Skeletonema_marinoi.AAC.1